MFVVITLLSFQSNISYGNILWDNYCHGNSILLLQKKVCRTITLSSYRGLCKPFVLQYKIFAVNNQYLYSILSYTNDELPEVKLKSNSYTNNTRFSIVLNILYDRLLLFLNRCKTSGQKVINKIPSFTNNLPTNIFNKKIHDSLVCNPFLYHGKIHF